ncbi:MAG: flippase, partial [Candidatus Woesearchaeota archaeon]
MKNKENHTLAGRLITSSLWSLFARLFSIIVKATIFVYLVNLLGSAEYGIYTSVLAIISLFSIFFDFGISSSAAKYISENKYNFKEIIKQAQIFYGITFAFVFTILFVFSQQISDLLNANFFNEYLFLILLLILLRVLEKFCKKVFEGLGRVDISSKISVFTEWMPWVFGIILVILINKTAKFALYGKAIGIFISVSLLVFYIIKYFNNNNNKLNKEVLSYRKFIRYSIPLLFTAISFFIYSRSDVLMIQAFLGEKFVGVYGSAIQFLDILHIPSAAIGSAIAGSYFLLKKSDNEKLKSLFLKSTRYILMFYLPIGIGIFFVAKELYALLFKSEFSGASLVLMIYVPTLIMKGISGIYSLALDYLGHAKLRAISITLSAALNITLNLLLIPKYGIIGAACATQITYVPVVGWYIHLLQKEAEVDTAQFLKVIFPIF